MKDIIDDAKDELIEALIYSYKSYENKILPGLHNLGVDNYYDRVTKILENHTGKSILELLR